MLPHDYACLVAADSIADAAPRVASLVLTYPRFIHSQMMTYRTFARNAASSRAIPTAKLIEVVENYPVMPCVWGKDQKGMQAGEELSPEERAAAEETWLHVRDDAVNAARYLVKIGAHKQLVNRLLEPFCWITAIFTGCEPAWRHFLAQRLHEDAQPEIQRVAQLVDEALRSSTPRRLDVGEWHLPFALACDSPAQAPRVSAARCARLSYVAHDREDISVDADLALYQRLTGGGHLSPLEHQVTPAARDVVAPGCCGPRWHQLRHLAETDARFQSSPK